MVRSSSPILSPRHGSAAFGTLLVITGGSRLMRRLFTAAGTNAVSSRPCTYASTALTCTTALASTLPALAFAHSATCSSALASRSCSVSSWHVPFLLVIRCLRFNPESLSLNSIRFKKFSWINFQDFLPSPPIWP